MPAISIRNQIAGTVSDLAGGGAMTRVRAATAVGDLTSVITNDAAAALDLAVDSPVVVLIKSTEVSLAV